MRNYYLKNKGKFASNPEYLRNYILQKNYGISLEVYNKMFEDQKGCCAICGKHQSEFKHALHVDHNHETGEVRKLLCVNCNTIVGKCKENPEILRRAMNYLYTNNIKEN